MKRLNKLFLIHFCFLFIVCVSCTSQINSLNDLKGKWKVSKLQSLLPGTFNETKSEYKDRMNSLKACVGSNVYMSDTSIVFNEKKCSFFNCKDLSHEIFSLSIVNDSQKEFDDDNIDEKKQISKSLIKLIDSNYTYSTVKAIFTDCPTGYEDYRVIILLLSPSKIAVFQYYNIIVLERTIK
jgi:hypothetical protein